MSDEEDIGEYYFNLMREVKLSGSPQGKIPRTYCKKCASEPFDNCQTLQRYIDAINKIEDAFDDLFGLLDGCRCDYVDDGIIVEQGNNVLCHFGYIIDQVYEAKCRLTYGYDKLPPVEICKDCRVNREFCEDLLEQLKKD